MCQTHWFDCQELQHCWVFHAQQFPVCVNGPHLKDIRTTVGSIGVNMGQHPCGMNFEAVPGAKGGAIQYWEGFPNVLYT